MRPISTLVITDRRGTRLNCWNTMAHWARHSRTCRPSARARRRRRINRSDVASVKPIDHVQQRGLARAGAADDADHLAARHLERNLVDRDQRAELPSGARA